MDLRWVIRVSGVVAMVAAFVTFSRWEDPKGMLGGFAPQGVVGDHDRARGLLREGRFDEGIELARSVLEREPKKASSWELLANLHERRAAPGDEDEARLARLRAVSLYERAMRRNAWEIPEHNQWYRLGWLHRRIGDEEAAMRCFQNAREKHLELAGRARGELTADFYYNMACLAALTGDVESALDAWDRTVDAGFIRFEVAARDPDLDSIRADPRFVAAFERARARVEEQRERQRLDRLRREREQAEREQAPGGS